MTPFNMDDKLILHQTPDKPKAVLLKNMAAGILKVFKIMLFNVGGNVFPKPLKAPVVPISIVIKN